MRNGIGGFMRGRFGLLWCMAVLLSAMFSAKALLAGQKQVDCPPPAGLKGVGECRLDEAQPTEICKLLTNKTASEKAQIKSREIAKRNFKGEYTNTQYGVRVEIIGEVKEININGQSGVELFAKAWRGTQQLGFGKDGTVEIERFRIFNPPVLVEDPNGTIVREWTNSITGELKQRKLREDPIEAIRQVIAHNVTLVGKDNNRIIKDKVGNTTSTFYPDADPESTSCDGGVDYLNEPSYATAHGSSAGTAASSSDIMLGDSVGGLFGPTCGKGFSGWRICRSFVLFDTSSIPDSDTIDSATLNIYVAWKENRLNTGNDYIVAVQSSPASNTNIVLDDYDQCGAVDNPIQGSNQIDISAITESAYNALTLNSTGLGWISKTGITKFGLREGDELTSTEPPFGIDQRNGVNPYSADQAGTTQDPKLVVVHSVPTLTDKLVSYWKLDESSGNAADSVGSNTLTNVGMSTYGAAKINNGVILNGSSQYLGNAVPAGLQITGDTTVNAWAYLSSLSSIGIFVDGFAFGDEFKYRGFMCEINSSTRMRLWVGKGDNTGDNLDITISALSINTWYMMTWVYDATAKNWTGYINATPQATSSSVTYAYAQPQTDRFVGIGAIFWNTGAVTFGYLNGKVDELGLWNRKLTGAEITQLYNSGSGMQYPFTTATTTPTPTPSPSPTPTPTDATAPSGSITINNGSSYTKSSAVTLNLSATDGVGVTGYYLADTSSTPTASASGWTSVTSTTNFTANVSYTVSSGDGNKTVYVWYKDTAGNVSTTANGSITLDTTAPTVTITSPTSSGVYTSAVGSLNLGGSASDSASGIGAVTWNNAATGSNGTATGTTSWTISAINLSMGENTINVVANDGASNTGTGTIKVTYSGNVPTVTTSAATNVTATTATLNGTVNANGLSTSAWFQYGLSSGTYTGTTTTQAVSGSSTTSVGIAVSGLTAGKGYYYRIAASSSAGTSYGSELSFSTPDSSAPTGSFTINSGATYTGTTTVTLNLSATDDVMVSGYYVSQNSTTPSSSAGGWVAVSATTTYTGNISYTLSSGDGNKTVYVWYKDFAGNVSGASSGSITLDTTAPTVTITSPTSDATYSTSSSSISLGGSASDATSGVKTVTWSNNKGGSGTASGTASWTISTISLSAGDNVITVTATDNAGNATTDAITVTYAIPTPTPQASPSPALQPTPTPTPSTSDTAAPSGSITINSGASYTNATAVTLSLTATDNVGVTGYYLSQTASTPSASASGWTPVSSTTSYSGGVSYILNSGDGGKTVYVWYKDVAGNVSGAASDDITLDTAAPAVTITSPTSGDTYTTTSNTISLGGSASDATSGVNTVTWSSNKGGSGTANGTASWTISTISLSAGDNVITVKATDNAGNTATDAITVTYTIPAPTPQQTPVASPTPQAASSPTPQVIPSPTPTPQGQPPTVETEAATDVKDASATLNGKANPNGLSTAVWFEYGVVSGKYVYQTDTQGLSGSTYTKVSAAVTGLTAGTKYYYRIAAKNGAGTSYGAEMEFYKAPGTMVTPTPVVTSIPTPKASPTPRPKSTPTPGKGYVFGTVSDGEGNHLSGVTVSLVGANGGSPAQNSVERRYLFALQVGANGNSPAQHSATTDADGYYEFGDLDAGNYTLTYEKGGYVTQTQSITLEAGQALDMGEITLVSIAYGKIYGTVVDIKGNPVESVSLKLKGLKTKASKTEATDADGFFEFSDLSADTYVITAKKNRYKTVKKSVKIGDGESKEVEIEMRKTTKRVKEM